MPRKGGRRRVAPGRRFRPSFTPVSLPSVFFFLSFFFGTEFFFFTEFFFSSVFCCYYCCSKGRFTRSASSPNEFYWTSSSVERNEKKKNEFSVGPWTPSGPPRWTPCQVLFGVAHRSEGNEFWWGRGPPVDPHGGPLARSCSASRIGARETSFGGAVDPQWTPTVDPRWTPSQVWFGIARRSDGNEYLVGPWTPSGPPRRTPGGPPRAVAVAAAAAAAANWRWAATVGADGSRNRPEFSAETLPVVTCGSTRRL